jgi:hypothetical protein
VPNPPPAKSKAKPVPSAQTTTDQPMALTPSDDQADPEGAAGQ